MCDTVSTASKKAKYQKKKKRPTNFFHTNCLQKKPKLWNLGSKKPNWQPCQSKTRPTFSSPTFSVEARFVIKNLTARSFHIYADTFHTTIMLINFEESIMLINFEELKIKWWKTRYKIYSYGDVQKIGHLKLIKINFPQSTQHWPCYLRVSTL